MTAKKAKPKAKAKVTTKEPTPPWTASQVATLVAAATAAKDTFDSLRRQGVDFSRAAYEAGYTRLRDSLSAFNGGVGGN